MLGSFVLFEDSPDAMAVVDAAGVIMRVNAQFAATFACRPIDVLGHPINDVLAPPDRRDEAAAASTRVAAGQRSLIEATRRCRRDGVLVDVSVRCTPVALPDGSRIVYAAYRDIGEARRAQSKYRAAFRASPDPITIASIAGGAILEANEAFLRLLGRPRAQVVGRTVAELSVWVKPAERARLVRLLETTGAVRGFEAWLCVARGEHRLMQLSVERLDIEGESCMMVVGRDVTASRAAERALRDSREQLRTLAGRLEAAREEERALLAREIHDEFGQALMGLRLELARLESGARKPAELRGQVSRVLAQVDESLDAVRRMSTNLRPAVLDELGLAAAAEWFCRSFARRTGIPCTLDVRDGPLPAGCDHATDVFRVLQEALTNVARHAGAQAVEVRLDITPLQVRLLVRDDGCGIELGRAAHGGVGIIGMRERSERWGGSFNVRRLGAGGTELSFALPLPVSDRAEARAG